MMSESSRTLRGGVGKGGRVVGGIGGGGRRGSWAEPWAFKFY